MDRPHLAGSSLGGGIALELGRRRAVRSVTAFSPIGFWRAPGEAWCRWALRAGYEAGRRRPASASPRVVIATSRPALFIYAFGQPWNAPDDEILETVQCGLASSGIPRCPHAHAELPLPGSPRPRQPAPYDRLGSARRADARSCASTQGPPDAPGSAAREPAPLRPRSLLRRPRALCTGTGGGKRLAQGSRYRRSPCAAPWAWPSPARRGAGRPIERLRPPGGHSGIRPAPVPCGPPRRGPLGRVGSLRRKRKPPSSSGASSTSGSARIAHQTSHSAPSTGIFSTTAKKKIGQNPSTGGSLASRRGAQSASPPSPASSLAQPSSASVCASSSPNADSVGTSSVGALRSCAQSRQLSSKESSTQARARSPA